MASNGLSHRSRIKKSALMFYTRCFFFKYFVNITTIITESNPPKIAAACNNKNAAAYF